MEDWLKGASALGKLREPLMPDDEEPPRPVKRLSTASKVDRVMQAAAETADAKEVNPAVGSCLRASGPVVACMVRAALLVAPAIMWLAAQAYTIYLAAPKKLLTIMFGAALCFFGGTFAASIAAIEAFRLMGWHRVMADVGVLITEARRVSVASAQDDQLDVDGDGVADVEQVTPHQLASRKIVLAMRTVAEPARLSSAAGALWGAYLAVLATLRLEFAQTTAIALGLVETVQLPITRVLAPPVSQALAPLQLVHWGETLLDSGMKIVAIILAWYLQMVLSATYSALRGGRIFALALCDLIAERGWSVYVEQLPGVTAPFDPETSYLDEAIGYSLGAVGLFWQLSTAFTLPFPLSLLLLPLTIVEWLLRWQISFGAPPDQAVAASG